MAMPWSSTWEKNPTSWPRPGRSSCPVRAWDSARWRGLLAQVLSPDALRSLREMGAVEHELVGSPAAGADRFTVVAARGGDDIWIEVRRHRRLRAPAPVVVPELALGSPVPGATVHDAATEGARFAVTPIEIEAAEPAPASGSAPAARPAAAEPVAALAAEAAHATATSHPNPLRRRRPSQPPRSRLRPQPQRPPRRPLPRRPLPGCRCTFTPPRRHPSRLRTSTSWRSWAIEPTVPPIDFEVVAESDEAPPPAVDVPAVATTAAAMMADTPPSPASALYSASEPSAPAAASEPMAPQPHDAAEPARCRPPLLRPHRPGGRRALSPRADAGRRTSRARTTCLPAHRTAADAARIARLGLRGRGSYAPRSRARTAARRGALAHAARVDAHKADDKVGLLGLLRREGIDTSFVERLA